MLLVDVTYNLRVDVTYLCLISTYIPMFILEYVFIYDFYPVFNFISR